MFLLSDDSETIMTRNAVSPIYTAVLMIVVVILFCVLEP
jgi:flagellin-like protein